MAHRHARTLLAARRATALASLMTTAILASSCGGSGATASYSSRPSLDCMRAAGFDVSTDKSNLDLIAEKYAGRAAQVMVGGTETQVIFADDSGQAGDIGGQYKPFLDNLGGTFENHGNVAIAVSGSLPAAGRGKLIGCLKR